MKLVESCGLGVLISEKQLRFVLTRLEISACGSVLWGVQTSFVFLQHARQDQVTKANAAVCCGLSIYNALRIPCIQPDLDPWVALMPDSVSGQNTLKMS